MSARSSRTASPSIPPATRCDRWRSGDRPLRLRQVRGIELIELDGARECCGFGGTFAVKNADVSMAMLSVKWSHLVTRRAQVCVALDTSCLMHTGGALRRQRTGIRTMHLAEVLAEAG